MLSLIGWWLSQALDKPWQSVLICWSPSSLCQTQLLPNASTVIFFFNNLACVMWGSDWESMFCIILFFIYQATGCFVETYKNYLLIAWASKQPISRYRCPFFHSIWKIHWELTVKKHQYCFANISATEARIFMKFYMVVNYYLVILCIKFHSAWCINARARVEL